MVVALFIGAKVGGVTGVFFAVPLTVILTTLLQEIQAAQTGTVHLEQA